MTVEVSKQRKHLVTLFVFGLGMPAIVAVYWLTGAPSWYYYATIPGILLVALGRTVNVTRGNFRVG